MHILSTVLITENTKTVTYCAYLGEDLSSTDTCWHPPHQVRITSRPTCSFQCS